MLSPNPPQNQFLSLPHRMTNGKSLKFEGSKKMSVYYDILTLPDPFRNIILFSYPVVLESALHQLREQQMGS